MEACQDLQTSAGTARVAKVVAGGSRSKGTCCPYSDYDIVPLCCHIEGSTGTDRLRPVPKSELRFQIVAKLRAKILLLKVVKVKRHVHVLRLGTMKIDLLIGSDRCPGKVRRPGLQACRTLLLITGLIEEKECAERNITFPLSIDMLEQVILQ
jgi:hypothetical protein